MTEEWKEIPYEKGYYVSNLGNVRRSVCGGGYVDVKQYTMSRRGMKINKIVINKLRYVQPYYVHRLVAELFCDGSGKYVYHKDGNMMNNVYTNLAFTDKMSKFQVFKTKPVYQYSEAGVFIKRHDSMKSAAEETGTPAGSISASCTGKSKKGGNFYWRYAGEKDEKIPKLEPINK